MASVTFNGREVQNPLARKLVATFAIVFGLLGAILALLSVAFIIVTLPVSIPLHFILKALGFRGFAYWEGNTFNYKIGPGAFRRWRF